MSLSFLLKKLQFPNTRDFGSSLERIISLFSLKNCKIGFNFSKSSLVSPGNPTIIEVLSITFGIFSFIFIKLFVFFLFFLKRNYELYKNIHIIDA